MGIHHGVWGGGNINLNWVYKGSDCFHMPKSQPRLLGSPADKHTLIANKESKRERNNSLKANRKLLTKSVDTGITGKWFLGGQQGCP